MKSKEIVQKPIPAASMLQEAGYLSSGLESWIHTTSPINAPLKVNEKIQLEPNKWKTVRLFLSSSFIETHAERDVITKKVIPSLNRRLFTKFIQVTGVDLRWGVLAEESNSCEAIQKTCLNQVDQCRDQGGEIPWFLGLRTQRYGWIQTKYEEAKKFNNPDNFEWLNELKGSAVQVSITSLECLHAILGSTSCSPKPKMFLYEREIENPEDIEDEYQWIFDLEYVLVNNHKDNVRKQYTETPSASIYEKDREALNVFLRDSHNKTTTYRKYNCRYVKGNAKITGEKEDGKKFGIGRVSGLEKFAKMVEEDLYQSIVENFKEATTTHLTANEIDNIPYDNAMKDKASSFIGRDHLLKTCRMFCGLENQTEGKQEGNEDENEQNSHSNLLVIHGEPGCGKSTLMASLASECITQLRERGHFVFAHAVDTSPGSSHVLAMLKRLHRNLKEYCKNHNPMNDSSDTAANSESKEIQTPIQRTRVRSQTRTRYRLGFGSNYDIRFSDDSDSDSDSDYWEPNSGLKSASKSDLDSEKDLNSEKDKENDISEYKSETFSDLQSNHIDKLEEIAGQHPDKLFVVIVDAINQFVKNHQVYSMWWLRLRNPPPNLRIAISTLNKENHTFENTLTVYPNAKRLNIFDMNENDAKLMVASILEKYHKKLTTDQMANLLSKKTTSPLYLAAASEALRQFGIYEKVSEYIIQLPDKISSIFKKLLLEWEQVYGKKFVRDTCIILCLSNDGILENTLNSVMEFIEKKEGIDYKCSFGRFYDTIRPYLAAGGGGHLRFFHNQLKRIVREKYLEGNSEEARIDKLLWKFYLEELTPQLCETPNDLARHPDFSNFILQVVHHQIKSFGIDKNEDVFISTLRNIYFVREKCIAGQQDELMQEYVTSIKSKSEEEVQALISWKTFICNHYIVDYLPLVKKHRTTFLHHDIALGQPQCSHVFIDTLKQYPDPSPSAQCQLKWISTQTKDEEEDVVVIYNKEGCGSLCTAVVDGKKLLCVGGQREAWLYELESGILLQHVNVKRWRRECDWWNSAVYISSVSRTFWVGGWYNDVTLFSLDTGDEMWYHQSGVDDEYDEEWCDENDCVVWLCGVDGHVFSGTPKGEVTVLQDDAECKIIDSWNMRRGVDDWTWIHSYAYSSVSKKIITAHGYVVKLWELNGQLIKEIRDISTFSHFNQDDRVYVYGELVPNPKKGRTLTCLSAHPHYPDVVALGGVHGVVVYNTAEDKEIYSILDVKNTEIVAYGQNGEKLCLVSDNDWNTVKIYAKDALQSRLCGNKSAISDILAVSDTDNLVTINRTGCLLMKISNDAAADSNPGSKSLSESVSQSHLDADSTAASELNSDSESVTELHSDSGSAPWPIYEGTTDKNNEVCSAGALAGGDEFFTFTKDGTLRIWKSDTLECSQQKNQCEYSNDIRDKNHVHIGAVAHPTEQFLVMYEFSKLWGIRTDDITSTFGMSHNFHLQISCIAFSPDGKYMVVGCNASKAAHVYTVSSANGNYQNSLEQNYSIEASEIRFGIDSGAFLTIDVHKDGMHVVTGGKHGCHVDLWNINDGKKIRTLYYDRVNQVMFVNVHIEGVLYCDGGQYGLITMDGRPVWQTEHHSLRFALLHNQQYLVTSTNDKTVHVFDMKNGKEVYLFADHKVKRAILVIFELPSCVIGVDTAGQLHMFAPSFTESDDLSSTDGPAVTYDDKLCSGGILAEGHEFFTLAEDGTLRIWNSETLECIRSQMEVQWERERYLEDFPLREILPSNHAFTNLGAVAHPIKQLVVIYINDKLFVVTTKDIISQMQEIGLHAQITCVGFSHDGKRMIVGCNGRTAYVFNVKYIMLSTYIQTIANESNIIEASGIKFEIDSGTFLTIDVHKDGLHVVTGGKHGCNVDLWKINDGKKIRTLYYGRVKQVIFVYVPIEGVLYCDANSVHLVALDGTPVWQTEHPSLSHALLRNQQYLVTFTNCHTVHLYNMNNGKEVSAPKDHIPNDESSIGFPISEEIRSSTHENVVQEYKRFNDFNHCFLSKVNRLADQEVAKGFNCFIDLPSCTFGIDTTGRLYKFKSITVESDDLSTDGSGVIYNDKLFSVGILPGGNEFFTLAKDGTLRIWNSESLECIRSKKDDQWKNKDDKHIQIGALAHPTKQLIVIYVNDKLFVVETEDIISQVQEIGLHAQITCVGFSPDSKHMIVGCCGTAYVFKVNPTDDSPPSADQDIDTMGDSGIRYEIEEGGQFLSVDIHEDGVRVVSGGKFGCYVDLWNIYYGGKIRTLYYGRVKQVIFVYVPIEGVLYCDGGSVHLVTMDGEPVWQTQHLSLNYTLLRNTQYLVTSRNDKTVHIYDMNDGKELFKDHIPSDESSTGFPILEEIKTSAHENVVQEYKHFYVFNRCVLSQVNTLADQEEAKGFKCFIELPSCIFGIDTTGRLYKLESSKPETFLESPTDLQE